jgi:uncharacterized phage protein (TIGR01671 family)
MREILFRGKTEQGEWVYGGWFKTDNENYIITNCDNIPIFDLWNFAEYVITETVGQFTGLTDRNGKKIFEGDIVVTRYPKGDICSIGDVQFDSGVFGAEWTAVKENKAMVGSWGQPHNLRRFYDDIIKNIEIIGNIHDNPELLGE